ncbi:MAG: protoporphyrinogen oxidase, partial [Candidatus Thermochlorobacter sp.]
RETAAEFVARRFGPEVLDYLINPFLAGTFGAKPEHLAADAAFKTLTEWEKKYGSVIKGAWQARKVRTQAPKKFSRKMFSFAGGFYDVVKRLAEEIGTGLWREVHVQSMTCESDGLKISLTQGGVSKKVEAKKIIVATPALQAAQLLESLAPELAAALKMIPYSPIAQVFLGYDVHLIKLPNGFGFLVPECEQRKILGIVFNSMIFPERYAQGAAMTVFIGGSRQPELAMLSEAELLALTRAEIKEILGIDAAPKATAVVQWHQAIPQYNLHHQRVIRSVEQYEQAHGNVFFTGNWRAGISVPDTIEHAEKIALQVAESLRNQPSAREFSH